MKNDDKVKIHITLEATIATPVEDSALIDYTLQWAAENCGLVLDMPDE